MSTFDIPSIMGVAHDYLMNHPINPVSQKTYLDYLKTFLSLTRDGATIPVVMDRLRDTTKASTFFKRKYALRYVLASHIGRLVRSVADRTDPEMGDLGNLPRLLALGAEIEALGSGCPIPAARKKHRASKRQGLSALPRAWREDLLSAMREAGSKWFIPGLTTALCACRPAELARGVEITLEEGGGEDNRILRILIRGAKVSEMSGQEERTIDYLASDPHPLVSQMAGLVSLAGGRLRVAIDNPKTFSASIAYFGREVFAVVPKKTRVVPYSFRHAFASDLKRALGDDDAVSRALGHRSDRTRSRYGQAQISRGGRALAPIRIGASHPVRHARSPVPGGSDPAPPGSADDAESGFKVD